VSGDTYRVSRRKKESDDSTLSYEEEMAEIYCPDLLSEVIQLRAEVKKLRGNSERQRENTSKSHQIPT